MIKHGEDEILVGDDLYHGGYTILPDGCFAVHCYDENGKQISGVLSGREFELRTVGESEALKPKGKMIVVPSECGGTTWQPA